MATIHQLATKGIKALSERRFADAVNALTEALGISPVSSDVDDAPGKGLGVDIHEMDPGSSGVEALLKKAKSADEAGRLEESIALYSKVIDADPDHMEARMGRGRLLLDRGDLDGSMSDYMVAKEVAPNHPEPQIAIGDLHFAQKEYRKAIEFFDLALSMDQKSAKAYCRRGISHYYQNDYPQALKDLRQAQKLDAATPNITSYISMVEKKTK